MNESPDFPEDPRVFEVLADYQQALERGQAPDRAIFLNRYPELASIIAECMEGLDLVVGGVSGRSQAPGVAIAPRGDEPAGAFATPLGDFQIVREIARGGMGVVYEAIQLSLGRRVALKVLPFAATFDSRQLQRFKHEAQAAALLHHTHIVPVYAVGCERGVHFYAMQLIDGQSLAIVVQQLRAKEGRKTKADASSGHNALHDQHLETTVDRGATSEKITKSPVPKTQETISTVNLAETMTSGISRSSDAYVRRVAKLIIQAADALEHAHQEGVVHRDIKPGNLLLDASGKVWVTDFGLAQLQTDNNLTRSGDLLGTFRYMSPEQTNGQRAMLDQRTDIYSLGATFYELLTLEPPFTGETHQELLYQILHTEPRPLRDHNRNIAPELETIVLKALSKNPSERYRTAAEFGQDIQRYLDHQPIHARRPSAIDRARKWMRRHPSAVVAAVLVLFIVSVLSIINNGRISHQQSLTKQALAREQDNFKQARRAVDALFQISEEELAERPFDSARQRVLEVVLSQYQDFIDQKRGDEASQTEIVRMEAQIKGILRDLELMQRDMETKLLLNPAVRTELGLTGTNRDTVTATIVGWEQEAHSFLSGSGSLLTHEGRRTKLVELAAAHEKTLDELLTKAQRVRLHQLELQSRGLAVFRDSEVIKALGLTTEQRAAIRDIEREKFASGYMGPQPRGGRGGPGGDPREDGGRGKGKGRVERGNEPPFDDGSRGNPGGRGGQRGMHGPGGGFGPGGRGGFGFPGGGPGGHDGEGSMEKALALLTDEQLLTWNELTGEPFTRWFEFDYKSKPDGSDMKPFEPFNIDPPPRPLDQL